MNPSSLILKFICESWPIEQWREHSIVVGVSGGSDSMALLNALSTLHACPIRIVAAHFNHSLRGLESDEDERFVHSQATRLGVRFVSEKGEFRELQRGSESTFRKHRYRFLEKVAIQHQSRWIATAHHVNDQVETFLHHLIRGSGPSGLSGIRLIRKLKEDLFLVRPLLRTTKEQLMTYLESTGQAFRTDRSNEESIYTRNRIRNLLLPQIQAVLGEQDIEKKFAQSMELIAAEHEVIETLAQLWLRGIDRMQQNEKEAMIRIPVARFLDVPWPVVRQGLVHLWHECAFPLREMNIRHWNRIQDLIARAKETTHRIRVSLPGNLHAECRRGILKIHAAGPDP